MPDAGLNIDVTRPDSVVEYCNDGTCDARFLDGYINMDSNGEFSYYRYDLNGIEGLYTVDVSDGTNSAQTTFTDSVAIYNIIIENPQPNSIALNPVRVSGTWDVQHAQGQLSAYNVQIEWGDGSTTNAVNIERNEEGSGNNKHFWGTFDTYPGFDHTYSSDLLCWQVTLIAKLYHAQPPGTEAGDTSANVTINPGITEICNNIDDDCDGQTDEDFTDLGEVCTEGQGECSADGVKVCTQDGSGTECNAEPGIPAPDDDICDNIDDDCNG